MKVPTFDDVMAARERLEGRIVRTPMLRSPVLDAALGAAVLVKPEPLQRTGSFKLRGATNRIAQMSEAERKGGVVTFSSGNHGQACAAAGKMFGAPVVVVMPTDAPTIKVESTKRWGAEIVHYNREKDDREAIGRKLCAERGATLVPPFDDADVIAGQGTAALELIADAKEAGLKLDALFVCTGGGGLLAGSALAVEGTGKGAAVIAVEPVGHDDHARSFAQKARVRNEPGGSTLCDALLAPMPGELTFRVNMGRVHGAAVVPDSDVLRAMRFAFDHLKLVAEPGGAVALAAALYGNVSLKDAVVGVIVSGGNVDPAVFQRALAA
ncbi:threonine ammonia-lyase [Elioraea rosea]|uniref:threonine ammonia-lyase n=1 Tax=Elioraea rosea TaxID=2492390 RepID=UPI001EF4C52B|nr:threonine/serine dehydratase [Elioraea rosea]